VILLVMGLMVRYLQYLRNGGNAMEALRLFVRHVTCVVPGVNTGFDLFMFGVHNAGAIPN
jgi:hypothetical protein